MKLNKTNSTRQILTLAAGKVQPCTKLEMQNIVFPKWSDIGLLGMMFRQCLMTKEQPTGNIYDEAQFQTVLRVLDGKLLMESRPDTYCWKFSKLQKAKNVRPIGVNCAEAILTMTEVLATVTDQSEKTMLTDMFANMKKDLLLVTSPAEQRVCIEFSQELHDAGITHCVDEWMDVDENGYAEATLLNVGDFLIVTDSGVYCIRRAEFLETHSLG